MADITIVIADDGYNLVAGSFEDSLCTYLDVRQPFAGVCKNKKVGVISHT